MRTNRCDPSVLSPTQWLPSTSKRIDSRSKGTFGWSRRNITAANGRANRRHRGACSRRYSPRLGWNVGTRHACCWVSIRPRNRVDCKVGLFSERDWAGPLIIECKKIFYNVQLRSLGLSESFCARLLKRHKWRGTAPFRRRGSEIGPIIIDYPSHKFTRCCSCTYASG